MTQGELISHLTDRCGCIVIRQDNSGYFVVRNVINGKMSGVPLPSNPLGNLKPATVCRICRTLDVEIPEEALKAIEVVDYINKNHNTITGETKPE